MVKSNAKEVIYSASCLISEGRFQTLMLVCVACCRCCCNAIRLKVFSDCFSQICKFSSIKVRRMTFMAPFNQLCCVVCVCECTVVLCPYLKRSCCKSFKNNMYLCHARRTSSLLLVCTTVLALACLFVEMQKVSGDCAQTRK